MPNTAASAPSDKNLRTTDITTNNASTSKHGLMPKLVNDANKVFNGAGGQTFPPGYEFDYAENTAGLTVTPTTDATATAYITGNAVTYDGTTRVRVDFFAASSAITSGQLIVINLYDGSTDLGRVAAIDALSMSIILTRFLTPSAAAHTYSIRAWKTAGTATLTAGAGGTATYMPSWYRITKA